MPTISANASSQITIPAGQRLRFFIGGAGAGQLAAVNGSDGQFTLGASEQMIGPFPSDRVFRVSATSTLTYQLQAPPFDAFLSNGNQVLSQDTSGNYYAAGSPQTTLTSLVSGAVISDSTSRQITVADNAQSLRPTGAITYTIPAGLSPMPSFTVDCPAVGTISIAVSGGATVNGAATTLTRARATNPVGFVVLAHAETDGYGVSGT